MQKLKGKLTVCFEKPFWVCVYERMIDGKMEVCKITFGSEPKDYEVYIFLLQNWNRLRFSPQIETHVQQDKQTNPKRMQREIKKQIKNKGIGTKAQQALKLQQSVGKETRRKKSHDNREQENNRRFSLRQEKKKQKRKGH